MLALTFMLDKEAHGGKTDHLRMEPRRSAGSVSLLASGQALGGAAAARNAETKKESEGDVSGQKETDAAVVGSAENSVPTPSSHFTAPPDLSALEEAALEEQLAQEAANLDIGASDDEEAEDEGANDASAESDAVQLDAHSEKGDGVENDEQEKQETSSDDDGEDDDGGGWITPKNVARHKAKDMGVSGDAKKAEEDVLVAVITSDFAMQVRCRHRHRRTRVKC